MDNFSHLMMIGETLLDVERTETLQKAIKETVKSGDIVLDGGTGSGILAMTAAKAGAKKVYAVELDPDICNLAKENVRLNKLDKIVEVINTDMKKLDIPSVNVVVMEMMDTGLIAEQQAPVINHLVETKIITSNTKVVPFIYDTYIDFVSYDYEFYGFNMVFPIQARNFGVLNRIKQTLVEKELIISTDLTKKNDLFVKKKHTCVSSSTGIVNSIVITSHVKLSSNISIWGTTDMNMPVIVPVEPRKLKIGERFAFSIEYTLAAGFETVKFNWS